MALGYQAIRNGDSEIVVAGGQESMSQAPHCRICATAPRWATPQIVDTMIKDGLWDAFNGYHMGNTAENVAQKWQITREQQDAFAVASQNKAEAAQKAGRFKDEIVAGDDRQARKGDVVVDTDEYPRHGTTLETLAKLRPAFDKDGTVTAGNASGINDGAAALVLMSAEEATAARPEAAGPHRLLGDRRRRSGDHGHRPDPGLPRGAEEGRLEVAGSRSDRGQRGLRRAGLRGRTRTSAGIPPRSTSMAAPSRSAIRSAPRARACW